MWATTRVTARPSRRTRELLWASEAVLVRAVDCAYEAGRFDVAARVRLLPTDAGGRETPIRSNYRPTFDLGVLWMGKPAVNDGRIMLIDQDELAPGAEGLVRIEPLWAEYWATVREGAVVPAQEGARVVGHVTVSLPAAGRRSRSSRSTGRCSIRTSWTSRSRDLCPTTSSTCTGTFEEGSRYGSPDTTQTPSGSGASRSSPTGVTMQSMPSARSTNHAVETIEEDASVRSVVRAASVTCSPRPSRPRLPPLSPRPREAVGIDNSSDSREKQGDRETSSHETSPVAEAAARILPASEAPKTVREALRRAVVLALEAGEYATVQIILEVLRQHDA